ncbi:conserved hypothetical protein [Rubrivivax sp. A210]|uniref:AHH domain-containing protein n=1 Tax=Rubrivivax sp. A210 TaxID=2772301 RepID=UPI001919A671|nr:AHH domain-containing protein [Rubrivivax sp. A210]CAD5370991.1 conserved hypothetical protein [Rubrivivax sp. A210]
MTQLGEAVKAAGISTLSRKCPFDEAEPPDDPRPEDEEFAWDDSVTMAAAQDNSASKLGNNLEGGSPGSDGSWNVLGGDPPRYKAPQVDTKRDPSKPKVEVDGVDYPFTVAAHHIIPGNASLYESQLFKSYMKKGGKMQVTQPKKKTFTVSRNIGYNINGSHNGVWLPGSYAIRTGVHPSKSTWSVLIETPGHVEWCYRYIAAVTKSTGSQFHDTHVHYSNNVLKLLNKMSLLLMKHQTQCDDCQGKDQSPPPYIVKNRLYRLSAHLRGKLRLSPRYWARRDPWMASDQVFTDIMGNPKSKAAFFRAYNKP